MFMKCIFQWIRGHLPLFLTFVFGFFGVLGTVLGIIAIRRAKKTDDKITRMEMGRRQSGGGIRVWYDIPEKIRRKQRKRKKKRESES